MTVKLTPDRVRRIRRLRGVFPQTSIANLYNVSQPTVSQIQTRKTWKEVGSHPC